MSNSREKLPKMVKSDFNLANLVFFVKVSSFVGQDRLILNCLRSGDLKLQRGELIPVRDQAISNYRDGEGRYRSAGACPPRSVHGEGQALALR